MVLLAAVSLLTVGLPTAAQASDPGARTTPTSSPGLSTGVRLQAGGKGSTPGVRRLFFANTVGNIGNGPLELRAENNAATGTTNAVQEIYTHTGPVGGKNPSITLVSSSTVGTFGFHPAHNHWHMADFARYELHVINGDGTTGAVVAATDKVSFCMIDTDTIDPPASHFRHGALPQLCGRTRGRGSGSAWVTPYSSSLPDQFIDVTTLPDGTYRLLSVADPNTAERPRWPAPRDEHANRSPASVDVAITRTAATMTSPAPPSTGFDARVAESIVALADDFSRGRRTDRGRAGRARLPPSKAARCIRWPWVA